MTLNHIQKCEARLAQASPDQYESGLFWSSQMEKFDEKRFVSPKYAFHFVRAPVIRVGFLYAIRKMDVLSNKPSLSEVHEFLRTLFVRAQLSAECSIGTYIHVYTLYIHCIYTFIHCLYTVYTLYIHVCRTRRHECNTCPVVLYMTFFHPTLPLHSLHPNPQ